jgi:thiol-disulfide isomerase/thioredoxin
MPDKLVIFKANWCEHCREQVPKAQEIANKLGMQTEIIDLQTCPITRKAECDAIEFVPTMRLNGVEVDLGQLEARLQRRR